MWKALIKLVESWAYRCKHKYKLVRKTKQIITGLDGIERPNGVAFTYMCFECGDAKTI